MADTTDVLHDIDARLRAVEQEVGVIGLRIETLFTAGKYVLLLVSASLGMDVLPVLGGI
jgi:hypothetical protein